MMGGLCYENGRWKDLKKRILVGNVIKPDHITRPGENQEQDGRPLSKGTCHIS